MARAKPKFDPTVEKETRIPFLYENKNYKPGEAFPAEGVVVDVRMMKRLYNCNHIWNKQDSVKKIETAVEEPIVETIPEPEPEVKEKVKEPIPEPVAKKAKAKKPPAKKAKAKKITEEAPAKKQPWD